VGTIISVDGRQQETMCVGADIVGWSAALCYPAVTS